jgi:SAM-dependent methyltransferase
MDIRDLKFENESFDAVIDKGTMDALMCDRGDVWDPSEELIKDVKGEVDEVERVLKVGGIFLYITFGQPHFRKRHLQRDCWTIDIKTMGDAFHYFFYTMSKNKSYINVA